jgi:hypothetical protein
VPPTIIPGPGVTPLLRSRRTQPPDKRGEEKTLSHADARRGLEKGIMIAERCPGGLPASLAKAERFRRYVRAGTASALERPAAAH